MTLAFGDIVTVVRRRQSERGPILRQMEDVAHRYNGDWVIPLPDIEGDPVLPPLTPMLISDAIDFYGQMAGSVFPNFGCPALDSSRQDGPKSREYAGVRRDILTGTWARSRGRLKLRRAFRHLAGYATCSMLVMPDFGSAMPRIVLRDPITSYPEATDPGDVEPPANIAYTHRHRASWLRARFPQCRQELGGPIAPPGHDSDDLWDTVEWLDYDEIVLGVLGPVYPESTVVSRRPRSNAVSSSRLVERPFADSIELARYPNRAGMVPVVCPERVTLDRLASSVANAIGQVDLMAKLMALDIIATEKSIWPDRYVIGRQGAVPNLVGGSWKDGRTGETNLLLDAEKVGELRSTPDPNNKITMDRLERNFRVSSGLVPQAGGESYGALRTGRGIDSLLGAAVDPRIQEAHEIMEAHLPHLNEGIFATYQGWWNQKKFVLFTGDAGAFQTTEFTPATHIEIRDNAASYTIPGADAAQTTVVLGQMRQIGALSLHRFRLLHPWLSNPEGEENKILEESLEEAILAGVAQRLSGGEMPLVMVAMLEREVRKGSDIVEALITVDEEMRKLQATEAPSPEEGQVAAPALQPGIEGQAAPAAPAPPPAKPNAAGLAALLGALTGRQPPETFLDTDAQSQPVAPGGAR